MTKDLGPAVRFPPPLLFVAGLGTGVMIDRYGQLPPLWPATPAVEVVGALLGVMGLAIVYTGILTFRRFRTAIYPNRPAKLVVDSGIYAFTRNPMYLGMSAFYAGGVLILHSLGALVQFPIVLVVLHLHVIAREERHLWQRFPQEYAAYCARVRRWI